MLAGIAPNFVHLLMLPIYTRYLEPKDYGVISLIMALSSFMLAFAGLQLANSMGRFFFDYDEERMKNFFSTVFYGIVAVNALFLLAAHMNGERLSRLIFPKADIPYFPYVFLALVIVFFGNLRNYFNLTLRVEERGGAVLMTALVTSLTGAALGVYMVVFLKMGAYGALGAEGLNTFVGAAVLAFFLKDKFRLVFKPVLLKAPLRYSLPLIPHSLGGILFMFSDKFILGYYTPLASIGLYEMAQKFSNPIRLVVRSFDSAIVPDFMRSSLEGREAAGIRYEAVITKWFAIICFLCLAVSLFSEEIVNLLTQPAYFGASTLVPVLVFPMAFRGLYFFSANAILFEKKTIVIPLITFTAGALNIFLNLLFIPVYGIYAAAWTTAAAMGFTFIAAYLAARKIYPIRYDWKEILGIMMLTAAVFTFCFFVRGDSLALNILLKTAGLGVFAFFVLKRDCGKISNDLRALMSSKRT